MKNYFQLLFLSVFCFISSSIHANEQEMKTDPENTLIMELKDGKVEIRLLLDKAPEHVKRIKELAREKFYDGIVFHRVIDGFMAQTGDPTGTGVGGSKKPNLKAEFNDVSHERGICSMARTMDPNSANSQFFIMLAEASHLNQQYTVWGKVVSGMEFVDKIKKGSSSENGMVKDPDKIISLRVMADLKETQPKIGNR